MRIRQMTTAQLINLVGDHAPGNRYRRMIDDATRIEVLGLFYTPMLHGKSYILVRIVNNYGQGGRDRKVTVLAVLEYLSTPLGKFNYVIGDVYDNRSALSCKQPRRLSWNNWIPDFPSTLPQKTIDRMILGKGTRCV